MNIQKMGRAFREKKVQRRQKAAALICAQDYPLLTFIHPGFECASNVLPKVDNSGVAEYV